MHALLLAVCFLQDPLAEDIDKAVGNLYSDRHAESALATQELIEIGRRSIPKLLAELGKQRDAEKKKQIRARRLICEILGRIRDNSQPVIDALIARLKDEDEYGLSVAAAAAGALDAIADERTAGALVTALTSKQAETDKWLKYYCIHALGVMRATQGAEALKKALEDEGAAQVGTEDTHVIAAAAADALGRIRAKDTVDGLGKLLKNSKINPYTQQQVAVHAARALEKLLGESRGPLEGDQLAVSTSLAAWVKWWEAEEGKKNVALTKARIAEIAAAVEAYKRDHNKLPGILAYLREKPADHTGVWPEGGYYKGEGWVKPHIKDAWGMEFKWSPSTTMGGPYDIVSYGADKRVWGKGNDADIWNHDAWKAVKAAESKTAQEKIVAAIKKFKDDHDLLPDTLSWLLTKEKAPAGFTPKKDWPKEGYLDAIPNDAYGRVFEYKKPGSGEEPYDLISFGADSAPGGVDEFADLWNHDKWKASRVNDTKKKMDALAKAIDQFKKEQERWPDRLADLKEKPTWAKKWPTRGYWTELSDPSQDVFGNPFVFKAAGDKYELVSLGADGKEGGAGADEDLRK